MAPNKFIIERQVAEFRADNGLSASEAINLKSLLLKLNVLTIFRPLSDNFSGMCLKDGSGHRFMLVNSSHSRGGNISRLPTNSITCILKVNQLRTNATLVVEVKTP